MYWRDCCDRELGPVLNKETLIKPSQGVKKEGCLSIPRYANLPGLKPVCLAFPWPQTVLPPFPLSCAYLPLSLRPRLNAREKASLDLLGRVDLSSLCLHGAFCFAASCLPFASNCAFAVLPCQGGGCVLWLTVCSLSGMMFCIQ